MIFGRAGYIFFFFSLTVFFPFSHMTAAASRASDFQCSASAAMLRSDEKRLGCVNVYERVNVPGCVANVSARNPGGG